MSEQAALWDGGRALTGREAKEDALARGAPLKLRFRGKPVPEDQAALACKLHDDFTRMTEVSLPMFERSGWPSDSLTRVLGAVTRRPEVSPDQWETMMRNVLDNPWWDGPPSIGVVFGPKVVDQNLVAPARGKMTAAQRAEKEKAERTQRRLAVARGRA